MDVIPDRLDLTIPDDEARLLYRMLHQNGNLQDELCQTYQQLQAHYFRYLKIEELTQMLESRP